jgi:hypothetical protein
MEFKNEQCFKQFLKLFLDEGKLVAERDFDDE